MMDDRIALSREEVKALWAFMSEATSTLRRIEAKLGDHEERIRANHEELVTQRSEKAFTRWVLPVVISVGAVAIALWGAVLRRE